MGACVTKQGERHDARKAEREYRKDEHKREHDSEVAASALEFMTGEVRPVIDGEEGHLRIKPTSSGRMLLTPSEKPMTEEELADLKTILEDDPQAASRLSELKSTSDMGINITTSKSPAFLGLLKIEILSLKTTTFKRVQIQMTCEADKSIYYSHSGARALSVDEVDVPADVPSAAEMVRNASTLSETAAESAPLKKVGSARSGHERTFQWANTVCVFVVLYSQSTVVVKLRDKGLGMQPTALASFKHGDLEQGVQELSLPVKSKELEVGLLQLRVDYKWLRGTRDDGNRFKQDTFTMHRRKLKGIRQIVSHVSNVNHWMLSHDNIWPSLDPGHHMVQAARTRMARRDSRNARDTSAAQTASPHTDDSAGEALQLDSTADSSSNGTIGESDMDSLAHLPAEQQRWAQSKRKQMSLNFGTTPEEGKNAQTRMFDYSLQEALMSCPINVKESEEVCTLKMQLANMLMLVNDRLQNLEDTVDKQQEVIMELQYKLNSDGKDQAKMPYISGRFGYGLGRPAVKRDVLMFSKQAQTGPELVEWPCVFLGRYKTDSKGRLGPIEVPPSMVSAPGHYNIVALLPEDNTYARGSLYILAPGTRCVLFDMDGTLTVGDQEVVTQFALNAFAGSTDVGDRVLTQAYDQKARAHSRTLVRLWAAKGYQPIYLSGRQGSFYNLTLQWLIKHDYPPGPIHLTRTHMPTLPMYFSVGNFKVRYMEELRAKGFDLFAAYGNTGTDVRAYAAAGVPKHRTFTIGQAAGNGGTVKIKNFSTHLHDVLAFPDSPFPIPYVDLLWTALPKQVSSKRDSDKLSRLASSNDACGSVPMVDTMLTESTVSGQSGDIGEGEREVLDDVSDEDEEND